MLSSLFSHKTLSKNILGAAIIAVGLTACSGGNEDRYIARDVEVLYNLGYDNLEKGRYKRAAAAFDEVERQHPYSVWARRAQLMAAYAHYQTSNYDDAVLSAECFLQLHPGNPSASYAYYLIALCHYEQIVDVGRDQSSTLKARESLTEVVKRFPDSDYAKDAQLKLDLTDDHLAGKDMEIGRFYMRRQEYLAAANRFKSVIDNYQTTSHAPEAMHRLVESYLALGVEPEARRVAQVLGHNYPGSKWYKYSYDLMNGKNPSGEVGSFLSKLWPF